MNRLWIGIGILILLLGLGVGFCWGSTLFFGNLSQEIEAAGEAALTENWAVAGEKAEKCRQKWEKCRYFWASLTDHALIEEVQLLFSQLALYEKEQLRGEFAVCCRSLARQAEAMGEAHSIAWWSVL